MVRFALDPFVIEHVGVPRTLPDSHNACCLGQRMLFDHLDATTREARPSPPQEHKLEHEPATPEGTGVDEIRTAPVDSPLYTRLFVLV